MQVGPDAGWLVRLPVPRLVAAAEHHALLPTRAGPLPVHEVPFVFACNRREMAALLDQALGDPRSHGGHAVEPVVLTIDRRAVSRAGRR